MKHAKKIAAILLAVLLTFAMATTAFAAQEGSLTGGKITINDAVSGQTYKAYQLMYLESYNESAGTYTYKANSEWETWLRTQTTYLTFDGQGYITWTGETTDAAKKAFAKAAKAAITTQSAETVTADSTTVEFTDLKLGYYLVDTSLGTLCSLDTTNPNVTMQEKNDVPTMDKVIVEGGNDVKSNDVNIGDTVSYKVTITAYEGAQSYVLHDTMTTGLDFNNDVAVTKGGSTVDPSNYTVATSGYTDGDTFEVQFTQAFCDGLANGDQIVVTYSATLNANAVIGTTGNTNKAKLTYGDNATATNEYTTTTKTWEIPVLKYTMKDSVKTNLAGATFKLTKSATSAADNSDAIKFAQDGTTQNYKYNTSGSVTTITTTDTGAFTLKGLDSGTYYLHETAAPNGYNKLVGPVTIVIGTDGKINVNSTEVTTVEVENNAGSKLPMTGGIGTTIIYVAGGAVILGALVLLIIRRRRQSREA